MKRYQRLALLLGVVAVLAPCLASAQHTHGHGSGGGGMQMDTREVLVEDLKVTFQIMENAEHRKMLKDMNMTDDIEAGTTHNVAVVLTDQTIQQPITDAAVSMKVVDPGGKDQIKSLKYEGSMKSYDAYFSMPQEGRYEILVLVKTGDVKKTAGIYYDLK
ncbi:MAG: hypothetical protein U5R30_14495 [Deltaproteobacteria bacterium]|nr:hypothetical protein [Deltaproteobacteria bacterium]